MSLIDRYVLRQFVGTFLICFLSLTGLYIVFDAFTNMDQFLRCAENEGGLAALMATYYGYHSIGFFDRTAGTITLIAAMFTVTSLQRHNEMTALLSAGISRTRLVMPVIVAAATVTCGAALNRELVIPQCRDELARTSKDLVGDVGRELQPRYDNQTDILLRGRSTYRDRQRIAEPSFRLPPSLDSYGSQLAAENAFYKPPEGNRPGGYLLEGVTRPKDLASLPSLKLDGRPVVIMPRDAPGWLRADQCFVVCQINFDQLTGGRAWRECSSTLTLIAGLRNPSFDCGAAVRVAIHRRIVQPVLDITLLFLGLPLVLRRESRNVFIAMGLCMAVSACFSLVVLGFQYLGSIYSVSPALAAWAPLMIFVPMAVGMVDALWD